jgi:hypothetical protein
MMMSEIEVTDELIEAAKEVSVDLDRGGEVTSTPSKYIAAILAALPEELTNPKPELPSEPGWYMGTGLYSPVSVDESGLLSWSDGDELAQPERYVPFTRLVPEKPPVTADELRKVVRAAEELRNFHNYQTIADYVNGTRA